MYLTVFFSNFVGLRPAKAASQLDGLKTKNYKNKLLILNVNPACNAYLE